MLNLVCFEVHRIVATLSDSMEVMAAAVGSSFEVGIGLYE